MSAGEQRGRSDVDQNDALADAILERYTNTADAALADTTSQDVPVESAPDDGVVEGAAVEAAAGVTTPNESPAT